MVKYLVLSLLCLGELIFCTVYQFFLLVLSHCDKQLVFQITISINDKEPKSRKS